jgi:uncharacterized protein (DUF2147 family)
MKNLAATLAALALSTGAALADPVLGTWKTQPGDDGNYAHVTISQCGSQICGVLGKGFDSAGKTIDSPNIGRKMIWDMNADGGGSYSGGKIWAPDRDKTYNSKMALNGNTLKVSGCVLGICRSQTWKRLK